MAGKLFPETYIGDSEDVSKKTPTGKKHTAPPRDVKSASPLSIDTECHDSDHLADSAELKELVCKDKVHPDGETHGNKEKPTDQTSGSHPDKEGEGCQMPQKPQFMSLLDFRWLQEKEDEEAGQDDSISALEDVSSQETSTKTLVGDVQGLWPPPGGNTEEHLEHRVNEVSLIDSFEPSGKLTPSTGFSRADCPEGSPVDHEGYYLCDEEAFLKESGASTGYFPCYRTYIEFPRYQPPSAEEQPQSKESSCNAGIQCNGCSQDEAHDGEKRVAEANNNMKEVKRVAAPHEASRGAPHSGARPSSGGRKLDGPGGRRVRPHGDGVPEAGVHRKEQGVPKPCTPGGPACKSSPRISPAKEGLGPGPQSSSVALPTAGVARKSPQKRKHRACQVDEKGQATLSELKPLLQDQRSLPPSPEEKVGALSICCYAMEAVGESTQVVPAKERGKDAPQRASSTQSCRMIPETPSPAPEPRTTSSRLSFHSIVSWVWRIFRRPPQPSTSTSTGTETGRRPLASRLRLWITQHSSRITPEPP